MQLPAAMWVRMQDVHPLVQLHQKLEGPVYMVTGQSLRVPMERVLRIVVETVTIHINQVIIAKVENQLGLIATVEVQHPEHEVHVMVAHQQRMPALAQEEHHRVLIHVIVAILISLVHHHLKYYLIQEEIMEQL